MRAERGCLALFVVPGARGAAVRPRVAARRQRHATPHRRSRPARHAPPPPPDMLAIPDAVPRVEPRSTRGNPPFYEVFGKRYFVLATAEG